jgi:dTMP kinase
LNIPRPDVQVFLYLDPEISRNLALKVEKPNMDKSKDIHENDANHMKKASEAFLYVAKKFNWIKIDCVEN